MIDTNEKMNRWLTFLTFETSNKKTELWEKLALWLGVIVAFSSGIFPLLSFFDINKLYSCVIILSILCIISYVSWNLFKKIIRLDRYNRRISKLIGKIVVGINYNSKKLRQEHVDKAMKEQSDKLILTPDHIEEEFYIINNLWHDEIITYRDLIVEWKQKKSHRRIGNRKKS